MAEFSRSDFLKLGGIGLASLALGQGSVASPVQADEISIEDIKTALKVINLSFDEDDLPPVLESVREYHGLYPELREATKDAEWPGCAYRVPQKGTPGPSKVVVPSDSPLPKNAEDIAFASIPQLSHWIQTRKISSRDLTDLYLTRLKKIGPDLRCVVNLCEERARKEAKQADDLLAKGHYLGPLHGIPYGVKDLFDTEGIPTTWGVETFKGRIPERDSDVVRLLGEAGAVLVAKLSLGALAMGDVWWQGRTESPWDPKIGSSGSSAGSASAVASGLVAFAIGTETNGSIVSPSHNCRVTGLRPTFGSISRQGAMALCWSLDKVGPITRSAEDCAIVFAALARETGNDPSQQATSIHYQRRKDLKGVRLGYLVNDAKELEQKLDLDRKPWLKTAATLGASIEPVFLDPFPDPLYAVLFAECAAAFESFTRSDAIEDLEKYSDWPQSFRFGRLIPAVEYIQADRYRPMLFQKYAAVLDSVDAVLADDRVYQRIFGLNLTGFPQMLIPWGTASNSRALSCSLIGRAFGEGKMCEIGYALQQAAGFYQLRPPLS